jgi:hypothetical protein
MNSFVFIEDVTVHHIHIVFMGFQIHDIIPEIVPFEGMSLFIDSENDLGVDFITVLAVGLDGASDEFEVGREKCIELLVEGDFFGSLGDGGFLEVVGGIGGGGGHLGTVDNTMYSMGAHYIVWGVGFNQFFYGGPSLRSAPGEG